MTKSEFKDVILPFVELYWQRTLFMHFPQSKTRQIRLGQMVLFCRQSFVPDSIIILNDNDDIIDGFHVCDHNQWQGEDIQTKLEEIGVFSEA